MSEGLAEIRDSLIRDCLVLQGEYELFSLSLSSAVLQGEPNYCWVKSGF